MLTLVLALTVAAPPPPPALGELGAPLGHFGSAVEPAPKGGVSDGDRAVLPRWPGCEDQAVFLMRTLGGMARVVEQLQQSLDRGPGAEKRLFARKALLAEVMKHLTAAAFEAKRACTPPGLLDGYKLTLTGAPKKWCPDQGAQEGDFWFFNKGKPAAVISVQKGAVEVCRPRLSVALFDARGVVRVRLHGDWAGTVAVTLVGDRCQNVDFDFDTGRQVFVPTWKSCKG